MPLCGGIYLDVLRADSAGVLAHPFHLAAAGPSHLRILSPFSILRLRWNEEEHGEGHSTARRARGIKGAAYVRVAVADGARGSDTDIRWVTWPRPPRVAGHDATGARAKDWCLLIHAAASLCRVSL